MQQLVPGTVGILPAGALGVSFFFHLTQRLTRLDGRVCFLERDGSASGPALRASAALHIGADEIRVPDLFRPGLLECAQLPEVLLVCTQPDQLLGVLASWVKLFERGAAVEDLPVLVLASNGIYFQRVRQFLIERLEEGTLLGRLPDLWPDLMPQLVGRLMRGVTIQTGQREGSGAEAIYHPGPLGLTRLAGGDAKLRAHVAALLTELGGWFELAGDASPTRVEFDKALVNLTANLLGQLAAIGDDGVFRRLTVGEIIEVDHGDAVRDLVGHVVEIGRAVHAYTPEESVETIITAMTASLRQHAGHVPSSLQWIESGLRRGTLQPRLTPTEAWLLEPLIRYAHAAGLEDAAHYFEALTRRLERRLALAIATQRKR